MFDNGNTPQYIKPTEKQEISLVPYGIPQLLDFEVRWKEMSIGDKERHFDEYQELDEKGAPCLDEKGRAQMTLRDNPKDGEPSEAHKNYEKYVVTYHQALEPWLGQWLPVPFFRMRTGSNGVDPGPTNWARIHITRGDAMDVYKIVLAFDMQVEEKRDDGLYGALTEEDVTGQYRFRLACNLGELIRRADDDPPVFLDTDWVSNWLWDIWERWTDKPKPGSQMQTDGNDGWRSMRYKAYYLTMLEWLRDVLCDIRVFSVLPADALPVDVTLVLDIGNSRSTGLLVELDANQTVANLDNSTFYQLRLRDLDQPQFSYTKSFDTRVEFSKAAFGEPGNEAKIESGRRKHAFAWPSPIRTGFEATRLAAQAGNRRGQTGMSSPKRYLWDEKDSQDTWCFNTRDDKLLNITGVPLAALVNSSGTPLCCLNDPNLREVISRNRILRKQDTKRATQARFSRSSLMMFLLSEIILQAQITINAPAHRLNMLSTANRPRYLRQIVFTLPDGMPMAEQRIYSRWARWALRVLWQCLGWEEYAIKGDDYRRMPQIRCNWGEASCTQLVYLYNEWRKFAKETTWFFKEAGRKRQTCGRERQPSDDAPSIRVASIDIGGGTSDLCITTYVHQHSRETTNRIVPHPEFHDSFNFAGDEVLLQVIREHVKPALEEAMLKAGIADTETAFTDLFGAGNMQNMNAEMSLAERRNLRSRFTRQVLVPAALCVLAYYEQSDLSVPNSGAKFTFRDFFDLPSVPAAKRDGETERQASAGTPPWERQPEPDPGVLDYMNKYVAHHAPVKRGENGREDGEKQFDIFDVSIEINPAAVHETVRKALELILGPLCEVVNLYDCDALLLTGRPSRWQGIVDTIRALMPLPPSRIIPMYGYRVGEWYPFAFADSKGCISDPKTTVVVGAILCAVAEGHLENFSLDASKLGLASTARFIGELTAGQLKNTEIWLETDPQKRDYKLDPIELAGPIAIGFRQLAVERWPATRFYALAYAPEYEGGNITVKLAFTVSSPREQICNPNNPDDGAGEGEFRIEEIVRGQERWSGEETEKIVDIHLQTMAFEEGFWMDTGIICPQD